MPCMGRQDKPKGSWPWEWNLGTRGRASQRVHWSFSSLRYPKVQCWLPKQRWTINQWCTSIHCPLLFGKQVLAGVHPLQSQLHLTTWKPPIVTLMSLGKKIHRSDPALCSDPLRTPPGRPHVGGIHLRLGRGRHLLPQCRGRVLEEVFGITVNSGIEGKVLDRLDRHHTLLKGEQMVSI